MEEEKMHSFWTDKLAEIETTLINAKTKLRSDVRNVRIWIGISGVGVTFIILHYSNILVLPTWLLVTTIAITVLLSLAAVGLDVGKSKSEIEKIEAIKRIYLGFPESRDQKPEYFDSLVKINIENLAAYYSLVKVHTSQSFKVSLISSIIGFGLIVTGLIIGYKKDDKIVGYLASGSGLLIEFISGVLFFLYNNTVQQLKEYHDSLIGVQNILLSFKLIESTNDEKVKAEMIGKMLEYLVQKK